MHDNERIPASAETDSAEVRSAVTNQDAPGGLASDSPAQASQVEGMLQSPEMQPHEEPHEYHAEKENAMIDVHAPHGGIGTWKDFWIHLGTIALGLLIAIGLEQTVEWIHHLHQRRQLQEDLHAEAEKNLAIMDDDYRYFDASMAWIAENRERVDAMRAGHGKVRLSYLPVPPYLDALKLNAPLASVWTTAKEGQLVALLPREQARFYDRVYRQLDTYEKAQSMQAETSIEVRNFEAQFSAIPKKPWGRSYPDLSRMSPEQLDRESALLIEQWAALARVRNRLDYFYAVESAVLHGAATDSDVLSSNVVRRPLTPMPAQPDAASTAPSAKRTEKP